MKLEKDKAYKVNNDGDVFEWVGKDTLIYIGKLNIEKE